MQVKKKPIPGKLYRVIKETSFCVAQNQKINYDKIENRILDKGFVRLISYKHSDHTRYPDYEYNFDLIYLMPDVTIAWHSMYQIKQFWDHFESVEE